MDSVGRRLFGALPMDPRTPETELASQLEVGPSTGKRRSLRSDHADRSTMILKISILFLATHFGSSFSQIEETLRDTIVARTAEIVSRDYLDEDVGDACGTRLETLRRAGAFDPIETHEELARELTRVLRKTANDDHLLVRYRRTEQGQETPASWEDDERLRGTLNHGYTHLEILEGNIGYLKIRHFPSLRHGERVINAAMQFLESADALIFDLRHNPGGIPATARLQASYLFDQKKHVANLIRKDLGSPLELWTMDKVPGRPRSAVPVYVLTSANTFSAAESFSRWIQVTERGTIVGEKTRGGAAMVAERSLGHGFVLFVSMQRVTDPTGEDWGQTGILPDVPTSSSDALERAHSLAINRLNSLDE